MEQQPNLPTPLLPEGERWLDTLLDQASLGVPGPSLAGTDELFTKRVMNALPAASANYPWWRALPLAALVGSVSAALWYLAVGPLTLMVDHPGALPLRLLPVAVLYWVCWETCFVERHLTQ